MINEMMHRPVVLETVVNYMRNAQRPFEGGVGEIEAYANQRGIPVIPHETAKFIDFFCACIQPREILEIGTAIGFSASLMVQHLALDGKLTTIDRYADMYERAKLNFAQLGLEERVQLLEGDAEVLLPTLEGAYDLIFMDCAKAKYIDFLPDCLRLLRTGGVLIVDDIFQGGTVLEPIETVPRRVRKIHRKLNELLETVTQHQQHRSCILPLGDGILMLRKESEEV